MFTETSQLGNKPIFKPNALLQVFFPALEHGYDAEKTQIEIGNTLIIPDIVTV